MKSTPESYAAEWSTLTGRPKSDVYIPVDIRHRPAGDGLSVVFHDGTWCVDLEGMIVHYAEWTDVRGARECRAWIDKFRGREARNADVVR